MMQMYKHQGANFDFFHTNRVAAVMEFNNLAPVAPAY